MKGKFEVRSSKFEVACRFLFLHCLIFFTLPVLAATNPAAPAEKLVLDPPHGELPPSFWEQHGVSVTLGAVLLLVLLAGLVLWWKLRRQPVALVPIETEARRELEALRQRVEDGKTLSLISRAVRRYVTGAFGLPPEEMTTSELRLALGANERVGADLAMKLGDFLRRCDELKFAPSAGTPPPSAAAYALGLVELCEARRVQLSQAAVTPPPGR